MSVRVPEMTMFTSKIQTKPYLVYKDDVIQFRSDKASYRRVYAMKIEQIKMENTHQTWYDLVPVFVA